MPDEALITEIENVFAEIIDLGGQNEDSKIVPNLTVQDASPTNLDGWLIVSDDRDGDNILARKVGSVVYSDNDLVNVMFLKGGEAIAFQQGSESGNNGIWEIVPSTSTDIFYDKGQVGIGTATPGEALDVAGNITLDADIIHRGDTDTNISFTDDDIEFTAGGLSMLKLTETGQDLITLGPGSGDVDINFNGDMFLQGSDGRFGIGTNAPTASLEIQSTSLTARMQRSDNTGGGAGIFYRKSRGTLGTPLIINNNDFLSGFETSGYDGSNFIAAANITMEVDGTPGVNDMPGRITLWTTADGASSPTRRVTIKNDGLMGINGVTSPSTELDIGAGAIEFNEMTAPAAGAANTARLFTQDNGAGKTQLAVRFNTGAIQILATEP